MPVIKDLFGDLEDAFKSLPRVAGREATDEVVYTELSPEEKKAIAEVYYNGLSLLSKVSCVLSEDIDRGGATLELLYRAAGIFKEMLPEKKTYATPPTVATNLGAAWLFPQAIKYSATPSADEPAYTSWKTNSWLIDTKAGEAIYFFGDKTNFYKSNPRLNKHSFIVLFKNGLIEYGSTPSIQQMRIVFEGITKYGIYASPPVVDVAIEPTKPLYQYQTPFPLLIAYDKGVRWSAMPSRTGTADIRALGFVFYEYDLYPDLYWVE